MTIQHSAVRAAVSAGDTQEHDPRVVEHLESCDDCRRFSAQVAEIDRAASALAPPPMPHGLPDRVIEHLVSTGGLGEHRVRNPFRWQRVAAVAAAVVLIGAGGGYLIDRDTTGSDQERQVLLAAAQSLEEGGASEITIDSTTEVELTASGRDPDFSKAPPEVRAHMETEWARMMAELDRQLAELDARINDMLSQFDEQLEDQFGGRGPGSQPPSPGGEAGKNTRARPAAPDRASLGIHVRAVGAIDPRGGVQLEGAVTAIPGTVDAPSTAAGFAIDASNGDTAVRTSHGQWVAAGAGAGPLARVLADPEAIPSILRAAEGDVTVDQDGTPPDTKRYRFRLSGTTIGDPEAEWDVVVLIDGQSRLRQMRLHPVRSLGSTRTDVIVEVGGRGSLDPTQRPDRVDGRAYLDATSPLAPVAPAVRAALEGETR